MRRIFAFSAGGCAAGGAGRAGERGLRRAGHAGGQHRPEYAGGPQLGLRQGPAWPLPGCWTWTGTGRWSCTAATSSPGRRRTTRAMTGWRRRSGPGTAPQPAGSTAWNSPPVGRPAPERAGDGLPLRLGYVGHQHPGGGYSAGLTLAPKGRFILLPPLLKGGDRRAKPGGGGICRREPSPAGNPAQYGTLGAEIPPPPLRGGPPPFNKGGREGESYPAKRFFDPQNQEPPSARTGVPGVCCVF